MEWKIGDKIDNGTVVGIQNYECFTHKRPDIEKFVSWDEKFPNWRQGNILFIKFDIPTKQLSVGEFLEYYFGGYVNQPSKELAEEMYNTLVSTEEFMTLPEQAVQKCP